MLKKTSIPPLNTTRNILNNQFSLAFPEDWKEQSVYRFEGPQEDGIQHAIVVSLENDVEIPSLEKYAELQIRSIETELQGYQELKRGPLVLNNQLPAYELVYKWLPVEDRKVYQRAVWILFNNTGYMISATFSKKTWKIFGPEVDKIIKSFTVPI